MGVKGLNSFFKNNPELCQSHELYNSTVILDGCNVIHYLYIKYKVNFEFGGDYKKYADEIRKYMSAFLECNIKPIVIFDGGNEKSDKDISSGLKDRLHRVQSIVRDGRCSGLVLPLLAYEVFYSILVELHVPFAQCDYGADDQIAALANEFNCPVISSDNDFYIFDLKSGFINLNSIDCTRYVKKDPDGTECRYLSCKIYFIKTFLSFFPGVNVKGLALFGTLMGNDFVDGREFDNFFLKLLQYDGINRDKKVLGLLTWLQQTEFNDAVNQITLCLEIEKREQIKLIIENSVNGYECKQSNLSLVINNNIEQLQNELLSSNSLSTPCNSSLPLDFTIKCLQGHFPSFFINVISFHRVIVYPQVENTLLSSSYYCSLYIRRILYGILIRHDSDPCEKKLCLSGIMEYDCHQNSLDPELINPLFEIEEFGKLPSLCELQNLPKNKCMEILLKVLGVKYELFSDIPSSWRLFIGCVDYCLRNCKPEFSQEFIYALILNFIYFSVVKYRSFQREIELTEETCTESTSSKIISILSCIEVHELKCADKNLEKYTHEPKLKPNNPLMLSILSYYSQLQSCIFYFTYLNKLLNSPIENIKPEMCFSGTMLCNIAISCRSNLDLFVIDMLSENSNLHSLFIKLNSKMCKNESSGCRVKYIPPHKRNIKS